MAHLEHIIAHKRARQSLVGLHISLHSLYFDLYHPSLATFSRRKSICKSMQTLALGNTPSRLSYGDGTLHSTAPSVVNPQSWGFH